MTHRTIGVDLAIRGDHVAQIFEDGRPLGPPLRFRHDPSSLDAFVARAIAGLGDADTVQAVMEPTGMSWFPVAHRLADAGVEVARVKGKRVKALRRYLSEHAKTDLADAQVLAAMPGFGGPRLDPVHIPAARSHALQRLTKQRGRFQDRIAASKRRLLDLVRWASPALERVLPDLRTRLALALLQRWLDPDTVLGARKPVIARFIARHASGNHPHSGPFVDALVDGLRHAAREARALHRSHVDFTELQAEVAIEVDAMLADIEAVTVLERRIDALYAELQPDDVLRSIPGRRPAPRSRPARRAPHRRPLQLRAPHPRLLRPLPPPRRQRRRRTARTEDHPRRQQPDQARPHARRRHRPQDRSRARRGLLAADDRQGPSPQAGALCRRQPPRQSHLQRPAQRQAVRPARPRRTGNLGLGGQGHRLQRFTVPESIRASRRANRPPVAA